MTQASGVADEEFSISFTGPAFDNHEISASALAQSLLALDSLSRICAHAVYGRDAEIDVRVQGSPKPGSFVIDLLITHPVECATVAGGAVTVLTGVIALAKWAYGRSVKLLGEKRGKAQVENESHDVAEFEKEALRIYGMSKTRIDLSRLTQTLDKEGADRITILGGSGCEEVITRSERRFFRHEDGPVISDNETQMALEVIGPRLNGSPDGWIFSEGEDGSEFKARVEDEEFLEAVAAGDYTFRNGTSLFAVVRTLQIRKGRTITQRSIIQVLEVLDQ